MMIRKKGIALVLALLFTLSIATSASAASQTFTIPSLDYFLQHGMNSGDSSSFVYTNTTGVTATAIFRITNVNPTDNGTDQVKNKLQGTYYMRYANGSTVSLGTISGSTLSGGLYNYLAPGASLVVDLKPASGVSQVSFKITFSKQ